MKLFIEIKTYYQQKKHKVTQINYYNSFANKYGDSIIASKNPAIWTVDQEINGPIFEAMKIRVEHQRDVILKEFNKKSKILDIGCGFGRQSFLLARDGFDVKGIDSSNEFITLAKRIFHHHHLNGEFEVAEFEQFSENKYEQAILLDVIEHIRPGHRKGFMERICNFLEKDGKLIVSFPNVDFFTYKSKLANIFNSLTYKIKQRNVEHPYPIPTKREFTKLISNFFEVKDCIDIGETIMFVVVKR